MKANKTNLLKFIFSRKKPKIVVVFGRERKTVIEITLFLLQEGLKNNKDFLVFESDFKKFPDSRFLKFLLKKSPLSILTIIDDEGMSPETNLFLAKKKRLNKTIGFLKSLSSKGFLVINSDSEVARGFQEKIKNIPSQTFGFEGRANLRATDINIDEFSTNLKIDYEGNIVPFWLKGRLDREKIYALLAAVCIGVKFNLNLVEISQILRNFEFNRQD